jgi:hypothetical protein
MERKMSLRQTLRLSIAGAALAAAVLVLSESVNSYGIGLEFQRRIPADVPEDIVTPDHVGRDVKFPRYSYYFRKGFQEVLSDYLVPRPYRIRNALWSIDSYAMNAVIDGRKACRLQLVQLSDEFGEARVLRALRWKYATWKDLLELHFDALRLTLGFVVASLMVLAIVRLTNRRNIGPT